MKLKTLLSQKTKQKLIHIIVFVLLITLFLSKSNDYPYFRWNIYTVPVFIISFYVHTFLFLPILIKRKKVRNYILLAISLLIVFTLIYSWLEAVRSCEITLRFDEKQSVPLDFFLRDNWVSSIFTWLFFSSIPFVTISLLYYISILDVNEQKQILSSKFTELFVNIVLISSMFSIVLVNGVKYKNTINLFLLGVLSLFFYINTFFITPILLRDKNTKSYLLFTILLFTLFISSFKSILAMANIEIGLLTKENTLAIVFLFFVIFMFSFIYAYFRNKLKTQNQKLGAKDSELKLLKSQVNPHFLFNTLNTLYGTALEENASKTAESTAKLANLIRYMQEDINKDFIPLENEIKYLQDYIIIQELRCAIKPQIETEFKNIQNHNISPGLLIPFVENAFKYGIDPSKSSKLSVSIICDEKTINFKCINSYDENFKTYYKEQGFGIGIKNAKQRLELVYPKKHTFKVVKENHTFSVYFSIDTK